MTKRERPDYFKKFRDKDGVCIGLGDVVYGEDGKAFRVDGVIYEKNIMHPIVATALKQEWKDDVYDNETYKLKPKWLTHEEVKWKQLFEEILVDLMEVRGMIEGTIREKERRDQWLEETLRVANYYIEKHEKLRNRPTQSHTSE